MAETHRLIQAAMEKNDCILKGKYPLAGLNIWDAGRENNFLTSNCFLQYQNDGVCRTLNGNFVLEAGQAYNVLAVWRR